MIREDPLYDSPIDIVGIWNPERQFELASRHPSLPIQLKAVIVQRAPGVEDQVGDVVYVKSYELRLRGFHHEEDIGEKAPDLEEETNAILHGLFQGVNYGRREELLFRYAQNLRAQGVNREDALWRVKSAARACEPPFSEELAKKLFWRVWGGLDARTSVDNLLNPLRRIAEKSTDMLSKLLAQATVKQWEEDHGKE